VPQPFGCLRANARGIILCHALKARLFTLCRAA